MHTSIAKAGTALVACRLLGLAVRYFGQTGGGARDALSLFVAAAAWHVGTLLGIVVLFLLMAALWPARRYPISVLAVGVFVVLMIAGEADLVVSSITGAPLTPTVFRTFRGLRIVTSNEFLEPLKANLLVTLVAATVMGLVVLGLAAIVWRERQRQRSVRSSRNEIVAMAAAAVVLISIGDAAPWPVPLPIEVAFAREYLGFDGVRLRGGQDAAIRELREAVGLPDGAEWASDQYPLVYRFPKTPEPDAKGRRPDIVVAMIESLRAESLGFISGSVPSDSPHLDDLAASGVVFSAYTSNGFPSAPSIFSFHSSAWPHRTKEIVADFTDRAFDSLPRRLKDLGYDTVYVGPDPHINTEAAWLPRWYDRAIDVSLQGHTVTDRRLFETAAAEAERHDQTHPDQPLFLYIETYNTHYPFRVPKDADALASGQQADDLVSRYRAALRYVDGELGRFRANIGARRREADTLFIVLGDHAFYTDLRRTSGLPENDNQWTTAIFHGPASLIGPPRRVLDPASHVDMLPTVLAMVGDRRPSAALGRDLFGGPRGGRRVAFAIRPGGLRLDEGGYSTVVDARWPNRVQVRPAFPMLFSPVGPPPVASAAQAAHLNSLALDWSYLIESNRVWDDRFVRGH